jgi:hypothetical protein
MRTASRSSGTVVDHPASVGADSPVISPTEKTAAVAKVRYLEQDLFDQDGHIRRGVTRTAAEETVALINDLRHRLGWLQIDLEGRWRWPERAASRRTERPERPESADSAARSAVA